MRVYRRCGRCGKKQEFINTGKLRVNANGNRIDVWPVFRCKKCKRTRNMAVYERAKLSKLAPAEYNRFLCNDPELAAEYGNDFSFLRRNNAEFHVKGRI